MAPDDPDADTFRWKIEPTMRVFALRAYEPPARRVYQPAALP
jgi:hypothetical protein